MQREAGLCRGECVTMRGGCPAQVTTAGEASFREGSGGSGAATFQQPMVSVACDRLGLGCLHGAQAGSVCGASRSSRFCHWCCAAGTC